MLKRHCIVVAPPIYQGQSIVDGFLKNGWDATLFTFQGNPRHTLLNPVNWLRVPEQGRDPAKRFDRVLAKQALPFARHSNASALVVLRPDVIGDRTAQALRQSQTPIATWVIDSLDRYPSQHSLSPFAAAEFFLDGGDARGPNAAWLPLGVNERLLDACSREKTVDVLFIGNLLRPMYARRRSCFMQLMESDLPRRFRCSAIVSDGGRLKDELLRRRAGFPVFRAVGIEGYMRTISEARVCINVMPSDGVSPINDAFLLIPAAGTCQLADRKDYLAEWLTPERHFSWFDEGQLIRKIDELLSDAKKANAIVEEGRREVLARHTYRHRARFIIDRLGLEGGC